MINYTRNKYNDHNNICSDLLNELSLNQEIGTNVIAIILVPGCFTSFYQEPGTNIMAIIFDPECFTFI